MKIKIDRSNRDVGGVSSGICRYVVRTWLTGAVFWLGVVSPGLASAPATPKTAPAFDTRAAGAAAPTAPLSAAATRAETNDSPRTLEEFIAWAIGHNARLRASLSRVDAARQVPAQRRALPDPRFGFGYFVETPETRVGPQETGFVLAQKFPFFGKLGLRGDIAEQDARIAYSRYAGDYLDLIFSVSRAYNDYYRLYNVREVLNEESDLLRRMEGAAQARYGSGLGGQQDVLKAQLSLSQVEDALAVNRRDLATVTATLNDLLNRAPDFPLAIPEQFATGGEMPPINRLREKALKARPELWGAEYGIEKASLARSLAKREYFPDLTLGAQYVQVGRRDLAPLDDNGKDIFQVQASINIPLWLGKLRSGVREAEARQAQAQSIRTAVEIQIANEVEDAYERVNTALERVVLYKTVIIPQAEQTFMASEAGYQTGRVDFLDYLDSERMLLDVRKRYFGVLGDLGVQSAFLNRAAGVSAPVLND